MPNWIRPGIGLTTVCPGVIDTNIVHTTRFDVPAGRQDKVEARRAQIEKAFAAGDTVPTRWPRRSCRPVKKNKPIRPVAPEAYFVYGVAHLLPQAMRSSARASVMLSSRTPGRSISRSQCCRI